MTAKGKRAPLQRIATISSSHSFTEDDPLAIELIHAITHGEADRLTLLLDTDPGLITCRIDGRTLLHVLADAPGFRPNARAIVTVLVDAGADLNAHATEMWHHETPLHWAASNDDVELIDALLDAGADVEHPGSSIDGGPPISSAVGYGQWAAARRLRERGARIESWHAAALGYLPQVRQAIEAQPPPSVDDLSGWFWNACRGGQAAMAQYLLDHGADPRWAAPWSGETALDIAEKAGQAEIVTWLRSIRPAGGNAPA